MIYLDYNATAPLHPLAKNAMLEVMDLPNNASSIHSAGRAARKILEASRTRILNSVNAKNLVFCGSGTEANNLALAQVSRVENRESRIAISAIEHDSIFRTAERTIIGVDKNGVIDLADLDSKLSVFHSPFSVLVSIMLANNETGVIQPIKEAAKIAHKYGALVHTDAVQAFGRIAIDFEDLGADFMTISPHKNGGPMGVAALIYKSGIELKPIMFGGGQEKNKRPGTENITAISGWAAMSNCELPNSDLRDYLESEIRLQELAIIHGINSPRLPNTSMISMPNIEAATQLIAFDLAGICVSTGAACSSGRVEKSRVLTAMNASLANNAIRISTGWNTKKEDVEKFLEVWKNIAKRNG